MFLVSLRKLFSIANYISWLKAIVYERDDAIREGIFKLFATNHSPQSSAGTLRDLLCCLPRFAAPTELSYQNVFRVLIMQFIDAYAFDVRSVKKSCVHIVHPDGWLIQLDKTALAPLRKQQEARVSA